MRMHTELRIYFMHVAVALPDTTDELMHVHALVLELLRLRAPRSLLVSVGVFQRGILPFGLPPGRREMFEYAHNAALEGVF